jgi:hypothetical protein
MRSMALARRGSRFPFLAASRYRDQGSRVELNDCKWELTLALEISAETFPRNYFKFWR